MKLTKKEMAWFLDNMPEEVELEKGIEILKKLSKIAKDREFLYIEMQMAGTGGK